MKCKYLLFGFFLFCFFIPKGIYAVKFIRKAESGVRIYKCKQYYGDVRVITLGKGIYRVFSIPFNGELEAGSPTEAARAACKESNLPIKRITNPSPSRNPPDCD
ncbi:hypothetical protein KJ966_10405 [bacterium]|nr:hypothetical protein [bacterium]